MAAKDLDPAVQAELADMALALAHNPKTRKQFAQAAKAAGLPYRFNDVEAESSVVEAAGSAVKDALAQRDREDAARRTQTAMNAKRQALIESGRYDEATVKDKIEPFMADRGIADYEDGATLYAARNPPSDPRSEIAARGLWELPKGDWLKDPHGTARKMAYQAVGEIMQSRR